MFDTYIDKWEWTNDPVELKDLVGIAYDEARRLESSYVGTEHLLLGLIRLRSPKHLGFAREEIRNLSGIPTPELQKDMSSNTPLLDSFGTDLVQLAREGSVGPLFERSGILSQLERILLRKEKNSPVLVGESGVGKTCLVESLAAKIAREEVPTQLMDKKIVRFELPRFLGALSPRKGLETGFSSLLAEVEEVGDVILFIDDLHYLMGKSSIVEISSSLVNVLKDALTLGKVQIIGATTTESYNKHLEFDEALIRRLEYVLVKEPSPEETLQILNTVYSQLENYHGVAYNEGVIEETINLTNRYMPNQYFPDKAVEVLDDLGAEVRVRESMQGEYRKARSGLREVTSDLEEAMEKQKWDHALDLRERKNILREKLDDFNSLQERVSVEKGMVASVISKKTGIPLMDLRLNEEKRLENMEDILKSQVIGQDHAVHSLAKALRRSRVGLTDPRRPIGSFLFLGPTGVGKTELARALAEFLFGSSHRLVRFDMSEFRERHTTSRLIGAPPGYVGFGQGGELTERVRQEPYNIVLFDEMEKAHPEVLNLLLQIMEEGELRDGQGRVTDFSNTIVILTSNVGAELINKGELGFVADQREVTEYENTKERLLENLKKQVRPEFLNRFSDILVFRSLSEGDLIKIVDLRIDELRERMNSRGLELKITGAAKKLLTKLGYSKEYGARPLQRVIENQIEAPVSEKIVSGEITQGDLVKVRARKGAIDICLE
ncbi:MAG: ATP-dependent Clp protease ATP-binding subunit [Patescibacteria group bacterium]|nr:ATP-dependent Clp protease ATP-binding subunit [Patescibacteria group bacterium]